MRVKYTDVDYRVFSEASEYVIKGGSPYERSTYRYTPLLSWLMIPNLFISPSFGKALFIAADILIGYFIFKILKKLSNNFKTFNFFYLFVLVAAWLFNPIAINVSTRGNAESLISLLVLLCLDLLYSNHYFLASLMFYFFYIIFLYFLLIVKFISYGLAVHFKVYPLIFAPALFFFIDSEENKSFFKHFKFTRNRSIFTFCSAATFLLITYVMYKMYKSIFSSFF